MSKKNNNKRKQPVQRQPQKSPSVDAITARYVQEFFCAPPETTKKKNKNNKKKKKQPSSQPSRTAQTEQVKRPRGNIVLRQLQKSPVIDTTTSLNLHELLCDNEHHWSSVVKKESKLEVVRKLFRRKQKTGVTYHHMSAFLAASPCFPLISGTKVMEEIDGLAKCLVSKRNIYNLRRLKPKRKFLKLRDCNMYNDEIPKTINKIHDIFRLKKHIGPTNCAHICDWATKTINESRDHKFAGFVYKEAPFARAFRAKQVLRYVDPSQQRNLQLTMVNNLIGALCWWTLVMLRQIMIPITVNMKYQNFWRSGYLKILRKEMKEFKETYQVVKADREPVLLSQIRLEFGGPLPMSRLRLYVVADKLRPLFLKVRKNKKKESFDLKRLNSMLLWCLSNRGVVRKTILDSCKDVSEFLRINKNSETLFAYAADVAKCFASVRHENLLKMVEALLKNSPNMFTQCGGGRDAQNRFRLHCATSNSEQGVRDVLKQRMDSYGVKKYEGYFVTETCPKVIFEQIRSRVSAYKYRRGSHVYRVTNGVPQGHGLSSVLAFIYLEDFERKNWYLERRKWFKLCYRRYEDDFIIITTEQKIVDKMLDPLLTGKNTHQLQANPSKMKVSLNRENIDWCGVRMHLAERRFSRMRMCKQGEKRRKYMKL